MTNAVQTEFFKAQVVALQREAKMLYRAAKSELLAGNDKYSANLQKRARLAFNRSAKAFDRYTGAAA